MKYLQPVIIALLFLAFGITYANYKRKVESLTGKITSLEAALTETKDECETKIAYLKAAQAQREAGPSSLLRGENPPDGLIGVLSRQSAKKREETVREMSETLGLGADQERRVTEILDDFREEKKVINEKASIEKFPFFDSRYLDMINNARSDAMGKIRTVLGDDLYKKMIGKGYDLRLGLRAGEKLSLQ